MNWAWSISWAESRDHSQANLAVLCSIHHGEAHSTHALELTLTPDRLKAAKATWEQEVSRLDPLAILQATQLISCQWWYFNHLRVFEIAEQLGVNVSELEGFQDALLNGACDEQGQLRPRKGPLYVGYALSHALKRYMSSMLEAAMGHASVRNISDDLDRGTLDRLIIEGDLVFVQGLYSFTNLAPDGSRRLDWWRRNPRRRYPTLCHWYRPLLATQRRNRRRNVRCLRPAYR